MNRDSAPSLTDEAKIETAAEAMFLNRFAKKNGPWHRFKNSHPDIAEIFRENARVALKSIGAVVEQ